MDTEQMRQDLTIVIGRIQLAQCRMRKFGLYAKAQEDLEHAEAAAWRITERVKEAEVTIVAER